MVWKSKYKRQEKYYYKNRGDGKRNDYYKQWRVKNRERYNSYQLNYHKQYNKKQKEKFILEHKEEIERKKELKKIISKNKTKLRQKRYVNRKRGAIGSHTLEEWENLKKKYNNCCAKCGMQEPFTNQWYQFLTEDHITPVSKGGTNFIKNIQPLCHKCNCIKQDKT